MANIAELMLEEVNGQAAESLKNLTDVLGRVVTDLAERVADADREVARNEFTLARAEEKIVAEKGARAAVEEANHRLKEQFHQLKEQFDQLKEQFHQSNADALKQMHIKVDGQLHSTMVWKRHSPMVFVNVHPSSGSHVVLLPKHDGKSEGGQPAYQCSVCGAGLKAPAAPGKQGGQPEYQCSVCGAGLKAPAKRKRGA
jgi:hypothetical protein